MTGPVAQPHRAADDGGATKPGRDQVRGGPNAAPLAGRSRRARCRPDAGAERTLMTKDAIRDAGSEPMLVVTFHGEGADAAQLHGLARTFLPGHHAVSPQNDGDGATRGPSGDPAEDMAAFLRGETARTGAVHVTGIGYSAGADLLAAISVAHPDLFDAVVLMHPRQPALPAAVPDLAMTRVLVTAGRSDPDCPPDVAQELADWFTEQKADCILAWHPGGNEVPQSEIDAVRDFLV